MLHVAAARRRQRLKPLRSNRFEAPGKQFSGQFSAENKSVCGRKYLSLAASSSFENGEAD